VLASQARFGDGARALLFAIFYYLAAEYGRSFRLSSLRALVTPDALLMAKNPL